MNSNEYLPDLHLPSVTLLGIDRNDPLGINRAARISTENILFGNVNIITYDLIRGREKYSEFCFKKMSDYVHTNHVLIIHADGYVQNHKSWRNEFLEYDYIGALWEWHKNFRNGNGGFSLRSKKLLEILKDLEVEKYHPEDDVICRKLRPLLEGDYGIRFAPENLCREFSIEAWNVRPQEQIYRGQFGFHGYKVKGLPKPPLPKKR